MNTLEEKLAKFALYLAAVEGGATKKEAQRHSGLSDSTLRGWLADTSNVITEEGGTLETFAARYARACVNKADGYADRGQSELESATKDDWQVRKARADYYKWRASVSNPKAYGDKIEMDAGPNLLEMSREERLSRLQGLLGTVTATARIAASEEESV